MVSLSIWPKPVPLTLRLLPYFILAFVAESLLYGIHFVVFYLCFRILLPRRRPIQRMMFGAVLVMFLLATIDVAFSWHIVLRRTTVLYTGDSFGFLSAVYLKIIINLINIAIADCLLLIRCYVVWGRRSMILYVAGPILLCITVIGFVSEATPSRSLKRFIALYTLSTVIWNLVITILTAARIIWASRQVRKIIGPKMTPYYRFAVATLVESGVIYTISTLLIVIFARTPYIILGAGISIRVVCIMPTLLIVQIALGNSTQDIQKTVTRLQEEHTQQIVLDTIITTEYTPAEDSTRSTRSIEDVPPQVSRPSSRSSFDGKFVGSSKIK